MKSKDKEKMKKETAIWKDFMPDGKKQDEPDEKKEKKVKVEKAQDKHEVQNNLNEKVAFVRYGFIDEFRKIASKLTAVKRYAKAHPMKALIVALEGPAAAVEAYRNIESLEDIENKFNEKFPGEGLSLKDPNPKHIKFLSKVSE